MLYNGLKNDLNSFAKFIFIYETTIKLMNREKDFFTEYYVAYIKFKALQKKMKFLTIAKIANLSKKETRTLFFTKSKFQVADFCRHMRNSFVHGLLQKDKKNIYISDENGRQKTATGYLEYQPVKEFIIEVIKKYESK